MNPDRGYRKSAIPDRAKRVFEGVIFDIYQWEQKLYDGSTKTFEMVARPDTVVVFPVLDDDTILLVNDSQPGRDAALVAPGGRVDEGETPEVAARRELKEETGYEADKLVPFYDFAPQTKIDWHIYVYIAHGCHKVAEQNEGAGERIVPHPMTFDELVSTPLGRMSEAKEFRIMTLEAQLNPGKMEELRKKFLGP